MRPATSFRHPLLLLLGATTLTLVLVCAAGVHQLHVADQAMQTAVDANLANLELAMVDINAAYSYARSLDIVVLSGNRTADRAEIEKEMRNLEATIATVDSNVARLEKAVTDTDGRRLLRTFTRTRAAYAASRQHLLVLWRAGRYAEARALLFGATGRLQAAYIAASHAFVNHETQRVAAMSRQAEADYLVARTRVLAIAACAALAGMLFLAVLMRLSRAASFLAADG